MTRHTLIVPQPSTAQIDSALAGNLRRCGSCVRIPAGVARPAEMAVQDKKGKL